MMRVIRKFSLMVFTSTLLAGSVLAGEIKAGNGQKVPNIRWQDSNGSTFELFKQPVKARILHFWAAWCVPCRKEMPELLKWRANNPEVDVILLSVDARIAQTRHFIKKYQLDMQALLLNKDDYDALSVPAVPYSLFVAPDGRLLGYQYGMAHWESEAFNKKLLGLFATP